MNRCQCNWVCLIFIIAFWFGIGFLLSGCEGATCSDEEAYVHHYECVDTKWSTNCTPVYYCP